MRPHLLAFTSLLMGCSQHTPGGKIIDGTTDAEETTHRDDNTTHDDTTQDDTTQDDTEDEEVPCDDPTLWYADNDGDGYGIDNAASNVEACTQPYRMVANADDCNDSASTVHPGAIESCDGLDNNCDGIADDNPDPALGAVSIYVDRDRDGFGTGASVGTVCPPVAAGYSFRNDDCDDTRRNVNPGHHEVGENALDDDCDGLVDMAGSFAGDVTFTRYDTSGALICAFHFQAEGPLFNNCENCDFAFDLSVTEAAIGHITPDACAGFLPRLGLGFAVQPDGYGRAYYAISVGAYVDAAYEDFYERYPYYSYYGGFDGSWREELYDGYGTHAWYPGYDGTITYEGGDFSADFPFIRAGNTYSTTVRGTVTSSL